MNINNTGTNRTFILNGNNPAQPMRYVWSWWDGTTDVTTSGTVSKNLNVGGDPNDAFLVRYTCEAVNEVGSSTVYHGALSVNNPPSIVVGSPTLETNGKDFMFRTKASLIAYDLEKEACSFSWFAGGTPVGAGVTSIYGYVNGTYAGDRIGLYTGTNNYLNYDVTENGSLTCFVYDTSGGTTAVKFYLFGQAPTKQYNAPQALAYQASVDSVSEPKARIGLDEHVDLAVYTPASSNPTSFTWEFQGSNGWAATSYEPGTTTHLSDGAYRNTYLKSTYGETAGQKYAECRISDLYTGLSAVVNIPVYLTANNAPTITSTSTLPLIPASGDIIAFEAIGADADNDLLTYKWTFADFGLTLYGRKVYVSSSTISPGNTITGVVTVTDRMGQSVVKSVVSGVIT